jgi:hypothetical protein
VGSVENMRYRDIVVKIVGKTKVTKAKSATTGVQNWVEFGQKNTSAVAVRPQAKGRMDLEYTEL